jgi:hypothetical protein
LDSRGSGRRGPVVWSAALPQKHGRTQKMKEKKGTSQNKIECGRSAGGILACSVYVDSALGQTARFVQRGSETFHWRLPLEHDLSNIFVVERLYRRQNIGTNPEEAGHGHEI